MEKRRFKSEIAIFSIKTSIFGPWEALGQHACFRALSGLGEALGGPRPWKNVVLGLEIAIFSRKTSIFGPWEALGARALER